MENLTLNTRKGYTKTHTVKIDKKAFIIQIEGIENDVIRGKITDETFHKQMESVKETFKD